MTSPHEFLHPKSWKPALGYSNGIAAEGRMIFTGGMVGWTGDQTFDSDDFVFHEDLKRVVPVEVFSAAVVERHFNDPAGSLGIAEWQVGQPIMNIEPVATTCSAAAIALATAWFTFICSTRSTSHVDLSLK